MIQRFIAKAHFLRYFAKISKNFGFYNINLTQNFIQYAKF